MKNIINISRNILFVLFIICNAIIAAVGVWNLGLAQAAKKNMDVDGYLVFVGGVALLFTFILLLIELTRKNPITARVWFECFWVGFFFVLELCGAAALSAIGPGVMCTPQVVSIVAISCVSTRVLLIFTWINALMLLSYFLLLAISALRQQSIDHKVWDSHVRLYRWHDKRSYMGSQNSGSPPLPRFLKKETASIVAPQPRRPPPSIVAHRAGLSAEYDIEHFAAEAERHLPPPPAPTAGQRYMRQTSRDLVSAPMPSLYPQAVQTSYTTKTSAAPPPPQHSRQKSRQLTPSPPPLGNWPRANVVNEPTKPKRKEPPSGYKFPPNRDAAPMVPSGPTSASLPRSNSTSSRPTGPRRGRSQSSNEWRTRPPPLDLSKISSMRS